MHSSGQRAGPLLPSLLPKALFGRAWGWKKGLVHIRGHDWVWFSSSLLWKAPDASTTYKS